MKNIYKYIQVSAVSLLSLFVGLIATKGAVSGQAVDTDFSFAQTAFADTAAVDPGSCDGCSCCGCCGCGGSSV